MADLIGNVKQGLAIFSGSVNTDFQAKNGVLYPAFVREIRNGKLGPAIDGGVAPFNTTELLKNVTALGGASAIHVRDLEAAKGEPEQRTGHTVRAVPATVQNMAFIDARRRV